MGRYLTTGQVAQERKTSTETVRNYCDSGVIKATKSAGGHYRIEPAELDRLKSLESLPPGRRVHLVRQQHALAGQAQSQRAYR